MSIATDAGEQRLTVQAAFGSIGRFVRVLPGPDLAILIKCTGTGLLVRYAGNVGRRGALHHYATVSVSGVRLLPETFRPLPNWLADAVAKARAGKRVPSELYDVVQRIVHPGPPQQTLDIDEAYVIYKQARERDLDVDGLFDDAAVLEARYREERQLQAELDARVVRS